MEFADVNSQRAVYGMNASFARRPAARAAMPSRTSRAVTLVALIALAFPTLAMFELNGRLIFPHYIALGIAIPALVLLGQVHWDAVKPILPVIAMILISTVVNFHTANFSVVGFHTLHFVTIALLAASPAKLVLRFAKLTIMVYAIAILLAQAMIVVGLNEFVSWLLVQKEGVADVPRVAAFATEPSYAAMILLILSRFVLYADIRWMTSSRLALVLGALLASLSLFGVISAVLVLAMALLQHGNLRGMIGVLIGGVVLIFGVSNIEFFTARFAEMDLSLGARGLGTGTIRLLPYLYISDLLQQNPLPLFVGAGAGALDNLFFANIGRYYTANEHFSTTMAGFIYDYGLFGVLYMIFWWNRPKQVSSRVLYVIMVLAIMVNTGVGTYLFILHGIFALQEQKIRTAQKSLPSLSERRGSSKPFGASSQSSSLRVGE